MQPYGREPAPQHGTQPWVGDPPPGAQPWSGDPPPGAQPWGGDPAVGARPYGGDPGRPGAYPVAAPPEAQPGYPGPPAWTPPPRPSGVRLMPTRRELVTAGAVVLAMAAAGLLAGFLWAQLAPRLEYRVVQPNLALPVVPEVEEFVAADGRFVVLTLVAGALAGALCWWSRRTRGPVVLLALAIGGLAGAVVAWRFGMLLGPGYEQADLQVVGRVIRQPLELNAQAALVVEPIAAIVVYLLATGFSTRNDLGRTDAPRPRASGPGELSSGSG